MAVANAIAPEHLELLVEGAADLVPLVRHAGSVFCGPLAPASIGDYLAGPNHVLPTYGSARFSGALRVDDFRKHLHVVTVDEKGLAEVAPHVEALATYEGLPAHAESVRLRRGRA
jgi:histidinol dehydrogenase